VSTEPQLNLRFDNRFVRELPGDRSLDRSTRAVHGAYYSSVLPLGVPAPRLIAHSPEVLELLGLSPEAWRSEAFVQVLAGNRLLAGMDPYATCYGGHQFGGWAGQLGDGRVITLGEACSANGAHWELQLKGAGRTPYSRGGDGRAVLRASLREFLASEAMHHLGIPTTRALGLVTTGERVVRDILYDGNPQEEPGAIVCRVAPSFLRFGNFELFSSRGDLETLRRLLDHALGALFPELGGAPGSSDAYAALFHEICRRTAVLLAHFMRVGFVHGVLNTDNMSILGLTIDYGPFGFLDHFDGEFTPNTSDEGRYRFANQPRIGKWNLLKLAEALFPLIQRARPLEEGLSIYEATFARESRRMQADKLGLREPLASDAAARLAAELSEVLSLVETDMTLFFRALADVPIEQGGDASAEALLGPLAHAYYDPESLVGEPRARTLSWLRRYAAHARDHSGTPQERRARMNAANPCYVPRNYQAQLAIEAAERGDASVLLELLEVLRRPYEEQPGRERCAAKRPAWARERAGCSRLSCSS
jgi:uncharacterized protein YdiU (UPF0061 family)